MERNLYFNSNLKYLREKLGLSKEALGKSLGLKRGMISSYEQPNNPSEPKFRLLKKIAEVFASGNDEIDINTLIVRDFQSENIQLDAEAVLGVLFPKTPESPTSESNEKEIKAALREAKQLLRSGDGPVLISRSSLGVLFDVAEDRLLASS